MAEVTAQTVKKLRDKTGVGMMSCKKALIAADGDMDLAIEHLRKAGIAKAAKKAERTAKEGCVVALVEGGVAALVEVLCETDFVAKNERFRQLAADVARRTAENYDDDGDVSGAVAEAEHEAVGELVGVVGENIQVRRACRWQSDGMFESYLHMGGKIGVLIDVEGSADPALLKDACMHIAAFNPRFVAAEDVPPDVIEKEKEIAAAQVAGKPEHIIGKIVMGKVNKWYTETCLTRQPWIRDDKTCLAKLAPQLRVKRFCRWQIGEEL